MYRLLLNIFPQGKYCAVRELLFEIAYRIWWSVWKEIYQILFAAVILWSPFTLNNKFLRTFPFLLNHMHM